jgi:hypothetical protein
MRLTAISLFVFFSEKEQVEAQQQRKQYENGRQCCQGRQRTAGP